MRLALIICGCNRPIPMEAMMTRQKSSQAGFSLAELMVAILILAVGLLGLAELQITAMHGNAKSGSILAATSVAQAAIEEVMAIGTEDDPLYSILTSAQVNQDWPIDPVRNLPGSGSYKITYESAPDYGQPGSQIVWVKVTVESQGAFRFGTTRVSFETLKDRRKVMKS